ncbi:MAG TPA: NAD-dependent protein deacylase [Alphaproteobacteria bacterium]|nr:NAD-dependent protein deacylase [Alphaproteobacteria bacterium]
MAAGGEAQAFAFEIERAAALLVSSHYVIALTGAGVSVESGIPPFRGPGGLWTKHGEPPMDGYQRFLADPKGYWLQRLTAPSEIVRALADAQPNAGHRAMVELETLGILRHLITQNIDNLHRAAGHQRLAEIHGNARLLRCIGCGERFTTDAMPISPADLPPRCPQCFGIIKSDTVHFGEPIPPAVLDVCFRETRRADCILVAGTSAQVYPAASLPQMVKERGGVLIEVNLYATPLTSMADCSLTGPFGEILPALVERVRTKLTA